MFAKVTKDTLQPYWWVMSSSILLIKDGCVCVCVHVCLCPESVSIKSELKLNHFSALVLYQTSSGVTKKKQALLPMRRFYSKARLTALQWNQLIMEDHEGGGS